MCAKLTAIWLKLRQALTWPMVWKRATGSRASRKPLSTRGTGCALVAHSPTMKSPLAAVWVGVGGKHTGVQGWGTWMGARARTRACCRGLKQVRIVEGRRSGVKHT